MDTLAKPDEIRVLLELRPALDRYSGIPQQTRLLFQALCNVCGCRVEGLIQSSTHFVRKGLQDRHDAAIPHHRKINRLARAIISVEQKLFRSYLIAPVLLIRCLLGFSEKLSRFDPSPFRDFLWQRIFSKSLGPNSFNVLTDAGFRILSAPWTAMHVAGMILRALGLPCFPRLDTAGFDFVIAETPFPGSISKTSQLIIRYHDAIPLIMPHTISDRRRHQAFHYNALVHNVRCGARFVCVSDATRKDLLSLFPEVESRAITIYNIVSDEYFDEASDPGRVANIINSRCSPLTRAGAKQWRRVARKRETLNYLLIVSTIEPRKNHLTLLCAWESIRLAFNLKLIVVGAIGWHDSGITKRFRSWIDRGELFMLSDLPASELRLLYKHARVTVCPSLAEGFDLSGVEAMRSGGAVVASDIPVHKEIYRNAAEYFDPYSVADLARALEKVLGTDGLRRSELVGTGAEVARRYTATVVLPQWAAFLSSVALVGK